MSPSAMRNANNETGCNLSRNFTSGLRAQLTKNRRTSRIVAEKLCADRRSGAGRESVTIVVVEAESLHCNMLHDSVVDVCRSRHIAAPLELGSNQDRGNPTGPS